MRVIFVSVVRVAICTALTSAYGVAAEALVILFDRIWSRDFSTKRSCQLHKHEDDRVLVRVCVQSDLC